LETKKSNREGTGKTHPCLYCNNLIPQYKKYCDRKCYNLNSRVEITCLGCGKVKKLPKNRHKEKYCSIKCSNQNINRKETRLKARNTLKSKYNTDNPFEIKGYQNLNIKRNGNKISNTYQNKPIENKIQISKKISNTLKNKTPKEKAQIRLKQEKTNIERYGISNLLKSESPQRNIIDLNNKNSHYSKLINWLTHNNLKLLDEYKGVKSPSGEIIYYNFEYIPTGDVFVDHVACGRLPIYKDPNLSIGVSLQEKELQDYIKDLLPTEKIQFNSRNIIKGFEIDIFIPHYNIAIEYNGLYWHSELNGKLRNYHVTKSNLCEEKGIQLIHIFEDEWECKKEIVKSKLKSLLQKNTTKIYARKCQIKPISNPIKNTFLNLNHLQGEDKSSIKYGLYYDSELISVITLGKLRKITGNTHEENKYELIRYASKSNTTVIGGFSKLLDFFIKKYNPKCITSYADRRWSIGKLYESNKFKFEHSTPPNYWYMKHYNSREHRYKYRKSELPKILQNYNPTISEWENMKKNKYDRIWDCGSKKYIMVLS
jgi:hypothetical protein